ncbi:hypothetical protein Tco_0431435 [Tanacetum coccineum]
MISTTIEADSYSICHIGSSQYAVSTGQYKSRQTTVPFPSRLDNHYCEDEEGKYRPKFMESYGASHINKTIPQKEKDPWSFTLPCFINNTCFDNALVDLGASIGEVKYPKGIAENVQVGIGKFTFSVDFIILDMPEDIKVPLILGRSILSTACAKIDVYKRKITLKFHNSIMKDKMVCKGNNVVGALMNVPIFVGTFSIMTDFAVLEDMDAYRDEGMGDVICNTPKMGRSGIWVGECYFIDQ